jgi:hypothetical protein
MSLMDFVVCPPGWGRSVTDVWGWGTHRAQFHCPDDVSDDMCERGVPGGALNRNSTGYPDHGCYGDLPLQGKIPTEKQWIEPRTSLFSSHKFWPPSHEAGQLIKKICTYFYQCHHMSLMVFVVSPPGCGQSVTDFWGWGEHRAQLICPDDVSDMCERGVPGGALNLNYTRHPDHGHHGYLPLQGKIPMVELGMEPGTSWSVVRNSDH